MVIQVGFEQHLANSDLMICGLPSGAAPVREAPPRPAKPTSTHPSCAAACAGSNASWTFKRTPPARSNSAPARNWRSRPSQKQLLRVHRTMPLGACNGGRLTTIHRARQRALRAAKRIGPAGTPTRPARAHPGAPLRKPALTRQTGPLCRWSCIPVHTQAEKKKNVAPTRPRRRATACPPPTETARLPPPRPPPRRPPPGRRAAPSQQTPRTRPPTRRRASC